MIVKSQFNYTIKWQVCCLFNGYSIDFSKVQHTTGVGSLKLLTNLIEDKLIFRHLLTQVPIADLF